MTTDRLPLAGARSAALALGALERGAARGSSLAVPAPAMMELCAGASRELVQPLALDALVARLVEALDAPAGTVDGGSAPRRAARQRLSGGEARVAQPPVAPVERPALGRRPRGLPPPHTDRRGAEVLAAAWREAGLQLPPLAGGPVDRPVSGQNLVAMTRTPVRGPAGAAATAAGGLEALTRGAPLARAGLAQRVAIERDPPRAASRAAAVDGPAAPGREAPAVATPRPSEPASRPPPIAAPSPVPGVTPPPPRAAMPVPGRPRGLSGLVASLRNDAAAPPVAEPAPSEAPSRGSPVAEPAGRSRIVAVAIPPAALGDPADTLPGRDAPGAAPSLGFDDIAHALERVLVRELRRHGVPAEEP